MEKKMPYSKSFSKLWKNVVDTYLGEEVPSRYRKKYGKRYDKKETKSIAFAIAKSRGIKIDK
jgi:hypothetical protein